MRFRAWDQHAQNVKHYYLHHVHLKSEIKLELQFQNCMPNTYISKKATWPQEGTAKITSTGKKQYVHFIWIR